MTLRAAFVTNTLAYIDKSSATSYQGVTLETLAQNAYATVLRRMARQYNWADLLNEDVSVTTVDGTATVTVPDLTNRIYKIIWEDDTNSSTIIGKSARWFDDRFPYPSSLGTAVPTFYKRVGSTITLANPPNAAKTLRIFRSIWPTADATTECQLLYMDDVIEAGMVAELYHKLALDTDANTWWTKFKQERDEAWLNDSNNPDMCVVAKPFGGDFPSIGESWKNPFYPQDD